MVPFLAIADIGHKQSLSREIARTDKSESSINANAITFFQASQLVTSYSFYESRP